MFLPIQTPLERESRHYTNRGYNSYYVVTGREDELVGKKRKGGKTEREREEVRAFPLRVAASRCSLPLTRQKSTLIARCVAVLLNSYGNAGTAGRTHKVRYCVIKSK